MIKTKNYQLNQLRGDKENITIDDKVKKLQEEFCNNCEEIQKLDDRLRKINKKICELEDEFDISSAKKFLKQGILSEEEYINVLDEYKKAKIMVEYGLPNFQEMYETRSKILYKRNYEIQNEISNIQNRHAV